MAAIKELNIGFCEGSRAFPRLAFLCPRKNILKNTCAVLRGVLHLCSQSLIKPQKMKQSYSPKTDKIVRTVLILAVIAIAVGVTYTWYLHHIKQFGN